MDTTTILVGVAAVGLYVYSRSLKAVSPGSPDTGGGTTPPVTPPPVTPPPVVVPPPVTPPPQNVLPCSGGAPGKGITIGKNYYYGATGSIQATYQAVANAFYRSGHTPPESPPWLTPTQFWASGKNYLAGLKDADINALCAWWGNQYYYKIPPKSALDLWLCLNGYAVG